MCVKFPSWYIIVAAVVLAPAHSILPHSQEVADLWLPLSGAEGEGKEGMIHIILSLTPIAPGAPLPQQPRTVPNVAAGGRPMTYTAQPQPGGQGLTKPPPSPPARGRGPISQ